MTLNTPCAAEKIKVTKDMLSPYRNKITEKYNISTGLVQKLIPTLSDEKNYVLHYRNLQLYLALGLKLKKVLRILEFNLSVEKTKELVNIENKLPATRDYQKLTASTV